ncbi:uncharacterized protein MYCFIDRAFT_169871 [Pseudocercospora fijiensis CIRAD86]|uniref:Uncharacterized protein n=1 Tax=Pseudocercospora fijiensis (strain CIRAD86) TaxID=383855 RepID=N1Q8V6_PSEFD|nr:uncharacterized protein MYCFIDRAFT_169871 [Pseudocercospora fijiensis CIRAD86]EME88211.1 hypothetical protein MYCFIDRAFT_169871 [Pseudocercospora fijiensis CIRAD86]
MTSSQCGAPWRCRSKRHAYSMLFLFTFSGVRVSELRDWHTRHRQRRAELEAEAARGRGRDETSVWETSECNNASYYGPTGVCMCACVASE